ncbi:MAG: molecular chaperone [Hyphomicrobiaceae bacterium]
MKKEPCCSVSQRAVGCDAPAPRQSALAKELQTGPSLSVPQLDDVDALVREALAQDFRLLGALNDREPTADLLEELRSARAEDWFAVKATSELLAGAYRLLDAALDAMPYPIGASTLDELAADYASIYLIHSFRAPPTESPWLDKDQLERQEPMFEIAQWYRRYGLAAQDRQRRADDHMVLQLQFLSHLFSTPELDMATSAAEASHFLDCHLLRWIGDFAERVATRCETPYYCGIATLTDGYIEAVREYLADRYSLARPTNSDTQNVKNDSSAGDEVAARYIPGVAPSW